jgi:hypothetical protein
MMAMRPFLLMPDPKGKTIQLQDVNVTAIQDDVFESALQIVRPIYDSHGADDKAAKGPLMLADLKTALETRFPTKVKLKRTSKQTTA